VSAGREETTGWKPGALSKAASAAPFRPAGLFREMTVAENVEVSGVDLDWDVAKARHERSTCCSGSGMAAKATHRRHPALHRRAPRRYARALMLSPAFVCSTSGRRHV